MWGYYGSKSKVVTYYPAPRHERIIEPFAGTAQYALEHWQKDVLLIDKYDVIVKLWKWLQLCSPKDILSLPRLKCGENVDSFSWDCEEARWLVGFIITGAPSQPKKTASRWKTVVRPNTQNFKLEMIAKNLHKIKHWQVQEGDWTDAPDVEATWFIDPPYQVGGEYYRHGNKGFDFGRLAEWSRQRKGQVIVCENTGGTWLPFLPLINQRGAKKKSMEVMWTNEREPGLLDCAL